MINFKDLNCVVEKDIEIVNFNGIDIEINKSLTTKDEHDLLAMTLDESLENGCYNQHLLDIHFHLYLVYLTTNINFDDDDRADEFGLYDKIVSSGLLDIVLEAFDRAEYESLIDDLNDIVAARTSYHESVVGLLETFSQSMPEINDNWQNLLTSIDTNELGELSDIMKYLGGGVPLAIDESAKD